MGAVLAIHPQLLADKEYDVFVRVALLRRPVIPTIVRLDELSLSSLEGGIRY